MRFLFSSKWWAGATLTTALIMVFSGSVQAQVLDDIENAVTQGNQYNDALNNIPETTFGPSDDSEIDGEAGVYILKKNKIFSAKAIVGAGYSENPGRTLDINSEGSGAAQFAVSAGVDTQIAAHFDAGANLVASGTEYERNGAPDSRNVVANAYVGKAFWDDRIYGSVSASYGKAMDGQFNNGTVFQGMTASVVYPHRITDKVIVRPRLTASRQWSEISEQKNLAVTAEADVIWVFAEKWQATGSIGFTHRVYDNFFEDVTFVERKDDVWRAGLAVSRQITDDVAISASMTYIDQGSAFFLSEFSSFDGGISIGLQKRF